MLGVFQGDCQLNGATVYFESKEKLKGQALFMKNRDSSLKNHSTYNQKNL
jgi:hypothetical protein